MFNLEGSEVASRAFNLYARSLKLADQRASVLETWSLVIERAKNGNPSLYGNMTERERVALNGRIATVRNGILKFSKDPTFTPHQRNEIQLFLCSTTKDPKVKHKILFSQKVKYKQLP